MHIIWRGNVWRYATNGQGKLGGGRHVSEDMRWCWTGITSPIILISISPALGWWYLHIPKTCWVTKVFISVIYKSTDWPFSFSHGIFLQRPGLLDEFFSFARPGSPRGNWLRLKTAQSPQCLVQRRDCVSKVHRAHPQSLVTVVKHPQPSS